MASQTSHAIMQAMRGDATRYEGREPEPDPTALAMLRHMRGDEDHSAIHTANAEGQRQYEAAVRKRAQELRAQNVPHAEQVARTQLQNEAQQRSEAERKRRVHESVAELNRRSAEREHWENRANRPLRGDRTPEPGAPYVTPNGQNGYHRDRTSERLMAQANGTVWDLYQQEQANA
ncbi:hypothetical protein [Streptomyces sp. NPDC002587]